MFVISDLHMGDGSAKDVLSRQAKESQLHRFLDEIERQGGQLLILGDLLELWRFDVQAVVTRWAEILDRFEDFGARFVPGNHDAALSDVVDRGQLHPFLQRLSRPYTQWIGDKRFRFMHGHEVDPFIPQHLEKWGQRLGLWAGWLEFNNDQCLTACDPVVDILLEMGEQAMYLWHWITRNVDHALHEELAVIYQEGLTRFKRGLRTRKMLSRFCHQRDNDDYDVAVVAHTHRAGIFNQWYFNSGCWTKPANNFLKIWPDGHVQVFDWDGRHAHANDTQVGT